VHVVQSCDFAAVSLSRDGGTSSGNAEPADTDVREGLLWDFALPVQHQAGAGAGKFVREMAVVVCIEVGRRGEKLVTLSPKVMFWQSSPQLLLADACL
jgi:hypothetical protein